MPSVHVEVDLHNVITDVKDLKAERTITFRGTASHFGVEKCLELDKHNRQCGLSIAWLAVETSSQPSSVTRQLPVPSAGF